MKVSIFTLLSVAFLGLSNANAQVKVGENLINIESSAALEIESMNKGFLPPRMNELQRNDIDNPAEGLLIYNTTIRSLEYFNGSYWVSTTVEILSGICAGEPASFTFNGLEYRPVESAGKCWLDRNLGASAVTQTAISAYSQNSQPRTTYTNAEQNSFGDLYQWGRAADGHEKRNSPNHNGTSTSDRPNTINSSGTWDGKFIFLQNNNNRYDWVTTQTNNAWNTGTSSNPNKTSTDPCPAGYRVPTEPEWEAERISWISNDPDGAFASPLKLPLAGYRVQTNGNIFSGGDEGYYWSSTINSTNAKTLYFFDDTSAAASMYINDRAAGLSVRCIKE